ncbi:hypothetical protein CRG98_023893 [Punica granatum]|uniref:Uncharacterized protein n=1 Tax=Punica granatum TaxID=22663 RepID=A0A2I0JHE1_PUNGR|nr:hypothetical protein CRG98_023893 [Punica granatum]
MVALILAATTTIGIARLTSDPEVVVGIRATTAFDLIISPFNQKHKDGKIGGGGGPNPSHDRPLLIFL